MPRSRRLHTYNTRNATATLLIPCVPRICPPPLPYFRPPRSRRALTVTDSPSRDEAP